MIRWLHTLRVTGPSGGAQLPATAARATMVPRCAPGLQVAAASPIRADACRRAIGSTARIGPWRSMSEARSGDRTATVRPNRPITSPTRA